MSKYYCLIAGLPGITFEDNKLPCSVAEFRKELDEELSAADKRLIDWFFYKFDNKNLLAYLNGQDKIVDERGRITLDEFDAVYKTLKDGLMFTFKHPVPAYMLAFLNHYIETQSKEDRVEVISLEDTLSSFYYSEAMKCENHFVANWFELNLNINNILTAITCRKHKLDKAVYVVGHNDVAETIRVSNARDFGLGNSLDYLSALLQLSEEEDLMEREKKIDLLKWKWLEDQTFFKTFDIDNVYAYLLRLDIMERWIGLDKTTGEKTFREIVGAMKKGSLHTLNEFKKNNNK